jgi:hypothetical protein
MLATIMLDWRPEIGTAATETIASNHLSVETQRTARSQVMPPRKAAQPGICALKHTSRQDRLAAAEDEFAFDAATNSANARL